MRIGPLALVALLSPGLVACEAMVNPQKLYDSAIVDAGEVVPCFWHLTVRSGDATVVRGDYRKDQPQPQTFEFALDPSCSGLLGLEGDAGGRQFTVQSDGSGTCEAHLRSTVNRLAEASVEVHVVSPTVSPAPIIRGTTKVFGNGRIFVVLANENGESSFLGAMPEIRTGPCTGTNPCLVPFAIDVSSADTPAGARLVAWQMGTGGSSRSFDVQAVEANRSMYLLTLDKTQGFPLTNSEICDRTDSP